MNDSYKINIHESKKQKCTHKLCLLLGTLKNLEQAAIGAHCYSIRLNLKKNRPFLVLPSSHFRDS